MFRWFQTPYERLIEAIKAQTLENNVNIEQVTSWMEKLIDDKITKGTVIDLMKKIDTIILQEINESSSVITFIAKEIIYDKPAFESSKIATSCRR